MGELTSLGDRALARVRKKLEVDATETSRRSSGWFAPAGSEAIEAVSPSVRYVSHRITIKEAVE